jgi:hypothetical protein
MKMHGMEYFKITEETVTTLSGPSNFIKITANK